MARLVIDLSGSPVMEAVEEIGRLYQGGAGVPDYVRRRLKEALANKDDGLVEMRVERGRVYAEAGHELLSCLATLRALRGAA